MDASQDVSWVSGHSQILSGASRRRRGLGGLIDKLIVPEEDDRDLIFQAARFRGSSIFFRHLFIRPDGGLEKRTLGELLFSASRCLQALTTLAFVFFNAYTVSANCWTIFSHQKPETGEREFILLIYPTASRAHQYFWGLRLAVAIWEVCFMTGLMGYSVYVLIKYTLLVGEAEFQHYRIWHQIYMVFCVHLPTLSNYSAMRSLQHLNPQLIGAALSKELSRVEEGASCIRVILCFLANHLLLGTLGFVAFVIKFAQLVESLKAEQNHTYGFGEAAAQVRILFGFANQAFGISQVWQLETDRLFLLLFGGADACMQAGELDRQEAYLASLAQIICTHLFVEPQLSTNGRRLRRAVAMLSFTHLDIQALVLDEDEAREVDARTLRTEAAGLFAGRSTLQEQRQGHQCEDGIALRPLHSIP